MKLNEAMNDIAKQCDEIKSAIITSKHMINFRKELSKKEQTLIQEILETVTIVNKKAINLLQIERTKRHKQFKKPSKKRKK